MHLVDGPCVGVGLVIHSHCRGRSWTKVPCTEMPSQGFCCGASKDPSWTSFQRLFARSLDASGLLSVRRLLSVGFLVGDSGGGAVRNYAIGPVQCGSLDPSQSKHLPRWLDRFWTSGLDEHPKGCVHRFPRKTPLRFSCARH